MLHPELSSMHSIALPLVLAASSLLNVSCTILNYTTPRADITPTNTLTEDSHYPYLCYCAAYYCE